MVKEKLSDAEEQKIAEQLKLFLHPKTLPDIIRKAMLQLKWNPDNYQVYIPKGDIDDEEHFVNAGEVLSKMDKDLLSLNETEKYVVEKILSVPHIVDKIDRSYRGLITRVKNKMVLGEDFEVPKEKKKPKNINFLTGKPIPAPPKKEKRTLEQMVEEDKKLLKEALKAESILSNKAPETEPASLEEIEKNNKKPETTGSPEEFKFKIVLPKDEPKDEPKAEPKAEPVLPNKKFHIDDEENEI
jgi:hypothetical protein